MLTTLWLLLRVVAAILTGFVRAFIPALGRGIDAGGNGGPAKVLSTSATDPFELLTTLVSTFCRRRARVPRAGASGLTRELHDVDLSARLAALGGADCPLLGNREAHASIAALHAVVFPAVVDLLTDGDFPLPLLGAVHTESRVESRLTSLAQLQRCSVRCAWEGLGATRAHKRGTVTDVWIEVLPATSTARGAPAWLWRSTVTLLFMGAPRGRAVGAVAPLHVSDAVCTTCCAPSQAVGRGWRHTALGLRLDAAAWRWCAVSGDYNPIHT
jgi:hypothetical protein